MSNELVMRAKLAHFMKCGSPLAFHLMGEGFTDLSESKNPKEYARQYVHMTTESTDVIGYSPSDAYSVDVYSENPVASRIIKATDEEQVGSAARVEIVEVHYWEQAGANTFVAYKREYAIIPDGKGSGTDALVYTGNFKAVGEQTKGTWNDTTKTFNATAAASLTFSCAAGATAGDTAISNISPAKTAGNSYVYRVSENTITLPNSGDPVDHTWSEWNESDDITAANGNNVALVEIDTSSECVRAGTETAVSN